MYFGGGTPSMAPETIKKIINVVRPYFAKKVEIGIEVHPKDASVNFFQKLKKYGVNRISLGIETFKEELLREIGRDYTSKEAKLAIINAQKVKFECTDVNLVYGIPGQKIQYSIDDIKECLDLEVDHLSAYPLITFEHTPLGKFVRQGKFREYNDKNLSLIQNEISKLCISNGYRRTSVWSFTKKNSDGYSTVTRENYIGFGPGAGSKVNGIFWFNTFSVDEYIKLKHPRPSIILETTDEFRRLHWLYWQIYKTVIDI
jgi:oxygen-independent coproporphyrinogen-3 oxidase